MLARAGDIYRREVLPSEIQIWRECFEGESERAVRDAFLQHLRTSAYFPRPADIAAIVTHERDRARAQSDIVKTQRMLQKNREARETGRTISFAEAMQQIARHAAEITSSGNCSNAKDEKKGGSPKCQESAPERDVAINS